MGFRLSSFTYLLLLFSLTTANTDGQTIPQENELASKTQTGLAPLRLRFPDSPETAERANRYTVYQTVRLDQIPIETGEVAIWISVPKDSRYQKLLNLTVDACPGDWEMVEDFDHRGSFVHTRIKNPKAESIDFSLSFEVVRDPVFIDIDYEAVGPMTLALNRLHAEHLRLDSPNMEVTPEFFELANKICGDEQNVALQAKLLLQYVADTVDHYSYSEDPKMPHCGIGNSKICKNQGGGCCTDLNSYFISLARARGIAAKLQMGYRLQDRNRNKNVDPGYRCWVEYFVPGYGWIPADVVEADTPGGLGQNRWISGLTSRRIYLNEGREFRFAGTATTDAINHMSIAYAEIDGVPARLLPENDRPPQISRTVFYRESSASDPASKE